jgi:Phage integrase, N-terminal SAM-like domain
VLFCDWLAEWWTTTTNLRPSTRARDEMLLRRYALPRSGDLALVAISQRDVRAWVAELSARGLAPATVQKAYQLLGKVMGAAVDAGMLAQSPRRRVPLPKVAEIVTEVGAVLRFGPPKTRAGRRTVGLPRAVVDELATHLAGNPVGPDAFVFTAPQGGPLRVIAFRARVWRPATRTADLPVPRGRHGAPRPAGRPVYGRRPGRAGPRDRAAPACFAAPARPRYGMSAADPGSATL